MGVSWITKYGFFNFLILYVRLSAQMGGIMKILMFGRGVISTQYGWALEKAGHEVEFYVRPGRSAEYGPVVNLNILDGRRNSGGDEIVENWPVTMRETIVKDHNYDLIIISVNHNQLMEVVKFVGPLAGKATVLIFNNIWEEPKTIENFLPKGQMLWGFPGGGGGFYNLQTLKAGFVKTVFLEAEATASSIVRHQQVVQLFQGAGFSVAKLKNIRNWLWCHFIMNAAMAAEALKMGGHLKAFESSASRREMVFLMREMLPLLKAKGGKPDMLTNVLTRLPSSLSSILLQKSAASGSLTGEIIRRMEGSGHTSTPEMNFNYLQDILNDRKKTGISLPRLMALESYFPTVETK